MIVTSWEEAREAIVEQRGERLAADIEALLRERELIRPGTDGCYDAEARIKELEGKLAHAEDRIDVYVAEEERMREFSLGHPSMCCNQCILAIEKAEARIKELEETLRARTVDRDVRLEQCRRPEARLEAVKALHRPGLPGPPRRCLCGRIYPCPTRRAAEGK